MVNPPDPGQFRAAKESGRKLAALTAYDYPTARILDDLGLDFVLVGDSLGMVVLGYPDTSFVTMDEMAHHCAAVARGITQTFTVGDMPAGSCASAAEAAANARRLLATGMRAVKIEGGAEIAGLVREVCAAGIPVMGHIGMLPQRAREEGGYRIKGRTEETAARLVEDARALEAAGVFAIVAELVAPDAARRVASAVEVPVVGIGSGDGCDGQILVTHDLIGMFPWFTPRFVRPCADVAGAIRAAVADYVRSVRGEGAA